MYHIPLIRLMIVHDSQLPSRRKTVRKPRDAALLANAAAVVLAHNHPSGDVTPSAEDLVLTERLKTAGELLGIPVLDHLIIGEAGAYCSLKDQGRM